MIDLPNGPEPEAAAPPATSSTRLPVWALPTITGAAGLLIGLLIGGVGLGAVQAAGQAGKEQAEAQAAAAATAKLVGLLNSAVLDCGASRQDAVLSDGGMTLTVDHKGDEDYLVGVSAAELWCMVDQLNAPAAVVSHMEQTTSMDGRQTESWGNIELSWSYHPDRGMDSVFTIVE